VRSWVWPLVVCSCGGAGKTRPATATVTATATLAPAPFRLPTGVRPTAESVELTLDPREEKFSGRVVIDVALDKPTAVVWLHAQGLAIRRASAGSNRTARVYDGIHGLLGLGFDPPLPAGAASVTVEFTGALDAERSQGLYRAAEADGGWYAYTLFEPTDARRAFPCFDEPGFKIPWRLTLVVPAGEQALANTPMTGRDRSAEGKSIVSFAETRPLPAYLVAFVVGPFETVPAGLAGAARAPLRFIVPRGRAEWSRYASAALPRIIELLEDIGGRSYPFEKLDVVIVPRTAGSMQHPGLLALGQPLALIDPDAETAGRRRALVGLAAHTLAHMWFGDLVTNAWWNDLWLSESLATWADLQVSDAFEPGWEIGLEAVARRDRAMAADALPSARRVENPVTTPDELAGAFDPAITYDKGAAVLAMFERWLGPKRFRQILARYLAAHAWKTATADDFIAALDPSTDRRLGAAFRSFLEQPGVPLVTAKASCPPGGPPAVELSQRRFVPAGVTAPDERWQIPVCVAWGDGDGKNRSCRLLSEAADRIVLDRCPTWILANDGAAGYYRSDVTAKGALALLATGQLSVAERLGLVGDLAAEVGTSVALGDALALVPVLAADPDPHVAAKSLALALKVQRADLVPELSARYTKFIRKSYGARGRALGWKRRRGETDADAALRSVLVPLLTHRGDDAELAEEARAHASRWLDDRSELDPAIVDAALDAAGASRSQALWLKLEGAAALAKDGARRVQLLGALGGFDDLELAKASLALLLGQSFDIRDTLPILTRELDGRRTREVAYAFVKESWDRLVARLRPDEALGLLATPTAFCDPGHRADAESFFGPRAAKLEGGARALAAALETVDVCIARTQADAKGLEAFLQKQ
jgi:aminopeptidase N